MPLPLGQPAACRVCPDIENLSKHAGGVVLYVGNVSGNLMAMHRYLGGSGKGPVEYGDMAIFKISDRGTQSVATSRFGN